MTHIKRVLYKSQAKVYCRFVGMGGFPLVIFNEAMDTAVVLSPATSFMSAMVHCFKDELTGDMTITLDS